MRGGESCVSPDNFTFPLLNRAVSSLRNHLRCGEMIHCVAIQMGFGRDLYFCNTLVEVYVKNCSMGSARQVFDEMDSRDLISWTTLISGYVCSGNVFDSFRLFSEMLLEGFEPNSVTLMIMFRACSVSKNVIHGEGLHGYVIKKGLESNLSVHNSILTMYSKTGNLEEAEILFNELEERDVVSWNIMISAYSLEEDSSYRVAESFNKMRTEVNPGVETLTLVISAFAKCGNLRQGEKVHGIAVRTGLCDIVLQTSLVDFYAKCGELRMSARLFNELPRRNFITWSAMISGFIQNGYFMEAIELFQQMQNEDFEPGVEILRNLVLAYTHLGALRLGKGVHCFVLKNIIYSSEEDKTAIETSILNMYAKCGSIIYAKRCFELMVDKDVVAWSSMIESYSSHGCGFEALETFEQMQEEGVEPNSITFLSLLSACSHSGLVSEGCRIFSYMNSRFGVKPDLNHYTCMVDLLGRSGKLQQAVYLIEKMDVIPDSRIWGALFAASRIHSDDQIGVYAAQNLLELEPDNAGYRTLLSNLHASAERWDDAETVRRVMSDKDMKKKPGWSCIETSEGFHGFVAGDGSHPQRDWLCLVNGPHHVIILVYCFLGKRRKHHQCKCIALREVDKLENNVTSSPIECTGKLMALSEYALQVSMEASATNRSNSTTTTIHRSVGRRLDSLARRTQGRVGSVGSECVLKNYSKSLGLELTLMVFLVAFRTPFGSGTVEEAVVDGWAIVEVDPCGTKLRNLSLTPLELKSVKLSGS